MGVGGWVGGSVGQKLALEHELQEVGNKARMFDFDGLQIYHCEGQSRHPV